MVCHLCVATVVLTLAQTLSGVLQCIHHLGVIMYTANSICIHIFFCQTSLSDSNRLLQAGMVLQTNLMNSWIDQNVLNSTPWKQDFSCA